MLLVGDIALGGDYESRYGSIAGKWSAPFLDIKPIFSGADLCIGNLESPLFQSPAPTSKRNSLQAQPGAVEALNFLGFNALSLANNHFTDQGPEGIVTTREILTSRNISHFGAGADLASARRAAFLQSRELTFAFLGYAAEHREVGARAATDAQWGCAPLSLELIEKDIAALQGTVAHIVVSLHWGYQYDRYPEPEQIRMARKIIDMGALIVHGHHPHVVQGMERYRNGLILYSLGNFFFADFMRTDGCRFRFPKEAKQTALVQCEVGAEGVRSFSLVPLAVGPDQRVRELRGARARRLLEEFARRSAALQAPDYLAFWTAQHKKTMASRARSGFMLNCCADVRAVWSRVRERGVLAAAASFRARHAVRIVRRVSDLFRRHSP